MHLNTRLRPLAGILLSVLSILSLHALAAPTDVGIVLLHGKWGSPNQMQSLARDLEAKGYKVAAPEAAWSGRRLYDKDYPAALQEIKAQADALRGKGAKKIVIAGQSLGANAAVAYATAGLEVDGIALLAPGHFPERGLGGQQVRSSTERARTMVAAGQGESTETFTDSNQGKFRDLRMKAAVYWSYFDPQGLAALTRNLAKLPRPMPVLLAIGTQDPFYPSARGAFDSAPAHAQSAYAVIDTDHFGMPQRVAAELLKWLEPLAQ